MAEASNAGSNAFAIVVMACTKPSALVPITLMGNCEGYSISDSLRGSRGAASVLMFKARFGLSGRGGSLLGALVARMQLFIDRAGLAVSNGLAVQRGDGEHFLGGGREQQLVGAENLIARNAAQLE